MFSERLKAARIEAGLSQKALAAKLFVSQQAVGKWEVDQGSPNPETIAKMAEIFGVSADYLLGRTDQKEKPPTENEELSADEQRLLSAYRAASGKRKEALLGLLEN